MRILHILGELNPSGAETMLRIAANSFVAKGLRSEIVSTGFQLGQYAPQLAAAGYKLHHLPFGKSPRFFCRLFLLLRKERYDVVHLHTERANFWLGLVASAARPKRVIRTVHSCFEFQGKLRWIRGLQRRMLDRMGVVHVSIGASVQENESKTFGLKTRLVPNWYDDQKFEAVTDEERVQARKALDIPENETVIITVGNCSKVKNHASLLQAIAMLPEEARPLYLHVGKEDSEQSERALVAELGITDRVRFFGPMADIRPLLSAADIFVMPSLYEGFGIAAVEALAMGLPVIFTDVPGLRDFKVDYPELLYAQTDSLSIKSALLEKLNKSDVERREQARSYPVLSKQLYGVERGVAGYYRLYGEG